MPVRKKAPKTVDQERKAFVIRYLRKASIYWPHRLGALKRARVGSHYLCEKCKKIYPKQLVHADHVQPAISPEGFDLATYAERLLCGADGFQVLCKPCHKDKTDLENKMRG